MRRLCLVRHATAGFDPGVGDYERSLSSYGHDQAPGIARALLEEGFVPEAIVCSGALRTRQTATWIGQVLGERAPTPRLSDELYNASEADILSVINVVPETVHALVVVTHMPGVQELAMRLSSVESVEDAVMAMATAYPPAGTCLFETDKPWVELDGRDARLTSFLTP